MAFYDLSKEERSKLVARMQQAMLDELLLDQQKNITAYFADADTYIRKNAYLAMGRIYFANTALQPVIINLLNHLLNDQHHSIRQTVVNAAGEIGIKHFKVVQHFFDKGLFDAHHAVRNAVIGSVKKMGLKNPVPVLHWARGYLHHILLPIL